MKNGLLIDWQTAGAMLAVADADDQAAFLKSFLKEMATWPTRHQGETQLCYINQLLTDGERERISMLGYRTST